MVVGVDVSSRRIDLSWLEQGKPRRWHQELPKAHLIDRLRAIRIQWPANEPSVIESMGGALHMTNTNYQPGAGVTDIAIEYPFGRGNAIAALMATVGVITRQAPPLARVAWPSSQELRAAIGARNTKDSAHTALWEILPSSLPHHPLEQWDEHSLDALVAAVGWTAILQQQDAA